MYVRIARFEGGDLDEIEAEGALMRDGIAALKRGESTHELPPRLAEVTSRVEDALRPTQRQRRGLRLH